MHNRIKALRNELNLTQQIFADQLGLKRNSIAQVESGVRNPSNSVINNICKTFRVNEAWLRTGIGDMFEPEPKTVIDELTATMGLSDFEIQVLEAYFKLDKPTREAFCKGLTEISKSIPRPEGKKEPALPEAEAGEEIYTGLAVAKGGEQSAVFQIGKREAEELYRREVERSNRTAASGVEGDDL